MMVYEGRKTDLSGFVKSNHQGHLCHRRQHHSHREREKMEQEHREEWNEQFPYDRDRRSHDCKTREVGKIGMSNTHNSVMDVTNQGKSPVKGLAMQDWRTIKSVEKEERQIHCYDDITRKELPRSAGRTKRLKWSRCRSYHVS